MTWQYGAGSTAEEELAERCCRVCYEEGTRAAPLLSPCACRGSQSYVHVDCLRRWHRHCGCPAQLTCPTCYQTYHGDAALALARLSLHAAELR